MRDVARLIGGHGAAAGPGDVHQVVDDRAGARRVAVADGQPRARRGGTEIVRSIGDRGRRERDRLRLLHHREREDRVGLGPLIAAVGDGAQVDDLTAGAVDGSSRRRPPLEQKGVRSDGERRPGEVDISVGPSEAAGVRLAVVKGLSVVPRRRRELGSTNAIEWSFNEVHRSDSPHTIVIRSHRMKSDVRHTLTALEGC